ncbi:MAG: nucleotidyltransferase [Bacillota bacterium]
MQATGIIVEYNPFHNGHLYHLRKAIELNPGQPIIAVMSGNFTQRGEPALLDKWLRTQMAVNNGVDLVIELPVISAVRSAEYFAQGAVQVLAATGIINNIVFGSENNKLGLLESAASLFVKEPEEYKQILKEQLKQGTSFPRARTNAVKQILGPETAESVKSPNNILAIEYIKAIKRFDLDITPQAIKRVGSSYHDQQPGENDIASATAIRNYIYTDKDKKIWRYLPEPSQKILANALESGRGPVNLKKWQEFCFFLYRQVSPEKLKEVPAGTEDLIRSSLYWRQKTSNYQELTNKLTSKTYPRSRVRRILTQLALNFEQNKFQKFTGSIPAYLRVLGLGTEGERLLTQLTKSSSLPVVIQPADYLREPEFNTADPLKYQLSLDILASDVYNLLLPAEPYKHGNQDFLKPLIKARR